MKPTWIVATIIGVSAIANSTKSAMPKIIWNASPSVPIGFYAVRLTKPRRGQLAVVRLGPGGRAHAVAHRYLRGTAFLLKPVAAIEGDRVCRMGALVLIGSQIVATARQRDASDKSLPTWSGCRKLQRGELFVLARASGSFDSRYLGVIRAEHVVGTARK